MEDFIKQNNLTIPSNIKPSSKKSWAGDRFWTLFFAAGMTAGFGTALCINITDNKSVAAVVIFWTTLLLVPTLVKFFNGTTFKNEKFFTAEGRELDLKKDFPAPLGGVIVFTVILTVLAGLMMDKTSVSEPFAMVVLSALLFFIPALFFIFKNCPISILFTRHLWRFEASPIPGNTSSRRSDDEASKRRSSITRSYYPGNMYYSSRHRR